MDKRSKLGKIDVFGVKEYKEKFTNHFEVIGVEVKLDSYHFASALGQILGYSVFCHRLYYAFAEESRDLKQVLDFAASLGIGVIKINKGSPKDSEILLYSKLFSPDKNLLLSALEGPFYNDENNDKKRTYLEECILCKGLVKLTDHKDQGNWKKDYVEIDHNVKARRNSKKEHLEDSPLQIERGDGRHSQYFTLCKDCKKLFLNL